MRRRTNSNLRLYRSNNYDNRNYSNRKQYETNARPYRIENYDEDVYDEDYYRDERDRNSREGNWHYTRGDEQDGFEHEHLWDMWDRMTNNEDRDYGSEYDRDRLERELGHGSRGGFGYSRYNNRDYADVRSIEDDIDSYSGYYDHREYRPHRRYNEARYLEETGYGKPWHRERNLPRQRRRRILSRRTRSERY